MIPLPAVHVNMELIIHSQLNNCFKTTAYLAFTFSPECLHLIEVVICVIHVIFKMELAGFKYLNNYRQTF